LHFVEIGGEAFGKFFGFGADFGRGNTAIFFESGVPKADLLPTDEGS
jgi:hypothetical protein